MKLYVVTISRETQSGTSYTEKYVVSSKFEYVAGKYPNADKIRRIKTELEVLE